jgi:hypothetical protein
MGFVAGVQSCQAMQASFEGYTSATQPEAEACLETRQD